MKILQIILMIWLTIIMQGCFSSNTLSLEEVQQKALQDDKPSQFQLALYYEAKKDFPEALKWLEKSASDNYYLALNGLGNVYYEGLLGQNKDFEKAFIYYQKASEYGYHDAINNLASMYDLGQGTKQDCLKAVELFEVAASKGSIRAMYNLGTAYIQGRDGVPKDLVQAYKWLDLARYYTLTSKNMTLKWSTRARLDELKPIMSPAQIEEAEELGNKWIESLPKELR